MSHYERLRVLSTAPSSYPVNLTGKAIGSTSIQLQWQPPPAEHHNGQIRSYKVLCTEVQKKGALMQHTTFITYITIRRLHPFYTYACNVSAVTVDSGPFSETINITTLEDGMWIIDYSLKANVTA